MTDPAATRLRVNGILASPNAARVAHRCALCERTIEKGETYLVVNGFNPIRVCRSHADAR